MPSEDRHSTVLVSARNGFSASTPAVIPLSGSVPPWRCRMLSIFATTPSSFSLESISVRGTSTWVPLENCTTVIATEPSSGTFAGSRSAVEKPSRCSCQSARVDAAGTVDDEPDVDGRRRRRRRDEREDGEERRDQELLEHQFSNVRPRSLKLSSTRRPACTVTSTHDWVWVAGCRDVPSSQIFTRPESGPNLASPSPSVRPRLRRRRRSHTPFIGPGETSGVSGSDRTTTVVPSSSPQPPTEDGDRHGRECEPSIESSERHPGSPARPPGAPCGWGPYETGRRMWNGYSSRPRGAPRQRRTR